MRDEYAVDWGLGREAGGELRSVGCDDVETKRTVGVVWGLSRALGDEMSRGRLTRMLLLLWALLSWCRASATGPAVDATAIAAAVIVPLLLLPLAPRCPWVRSHALQPVSKPSDSNASSSPCHNELRLPYWHCDCCC